MATTRKRRKKSSSKFIQSAISRPGALTARAKRNGRSVEAQARHDKANGGTRQKQQANFYLGVLKPSSKKRKKRSTKSK